MPSNALMPISKLRVSSSEIARQWLVKFAEVCQKEITPALANIWAEQLADIEAELLDRACDALMKQWDTGFLPVPGNIRQKAECLSGADQMERELAQARFEAKEKYQKAIAYAEHKRQHQLPAPPAEAPPKPARPKLTIVPVRTIEEQKEILRQKGFLPA